MDKKEQIEKVLSDFGDVLWDRIHGIEGYDEREISEIYNEWSDKILALSNPKEVETKKEVDFDELKKRFELAFNFDYDCSFNNLWDFFLPHLQKPVEIDAVIICPKCKGENEYLTTKKGYRCAFTVCGHEWNNSNN